MYDLHIATEGSEDALLHECGFYSITRSEMHNNKHRIWRCYTIQGVNPPREGRRLFEALIAWWRVSNLPPMRAKFEITIRTVRFGSPQLVPPTIDAVTWT